MSELLSSISGMISNLSTAVVNSYAATANPQDDLVSFDSFYQAYRQCRSNHETSVFVANHAKYLSWQLNGSRLSNSQISAVLERCIICKTLGHDVSFAATHAIQLAQSSQMWNHKLTAYLACCELLDEHSDLAILMVSTLLHDLRTKHIPTICLALSTAATVISAELIPSIETVVCDRLRHPSSLVRQRALLCLGTFLERDEELVQDKLPYLRVGEN